MQHFQRVGKYQPPQEPGNELRLPRMAVRSQFTITDMREEQKLLGNTPVPVKKEDIEDNDIDDSTPRLTNPIEMLKRTKFIEDSDAIPSERLGTTRNIPLLNPHSTYKTKVQANRSQLVTNNRSIYDFASKSLSSHG